MDNRTIRLAIMKRCPEIYFIATPKKNAGKIYWLMYAKIEPHRRPIELWADMPDTALISHTELLTTIISEIYDEIKALKSGKKVLADNPYESGLKPLSFEGQKVFDSPEIQYYSVGDDNIKPKSGIIMP